VKSKYEKYRIILSRIAIAIMLFLFITTQSYWEAKSETTTFVLFLVGIIFVGIASLGSMWCSLYIAGYKDNKLITKGPYSICRNPLYLFSLIGSIGVGLATETFILPIVFSVLFASYYGFVIKSEEERLRKIFGKEFEEYAKNVPVFLPRFSGFSEPENYNVKPVVYRKHIFSALWFIWIIGILEVIEGMKEIGFLKSFWMIY